jgi:signal transduction histidine kinase
MKQVFVRYVSHEIRFLPFFFKRENMGGSYSEFRSPLNVVIAGLDLVLTNVKSCIELPAELSSVIGMLEDIFEASNTAILILNDLLDYESMDAGK